MKKHYCALLVMLSCLFISGCNGDKTTPPPGNRVPAAPSSPAPANNAIDISTTVALIWQCSDPDNDPMTYDIYLGTQQAPPQIATDQTGLSYQTNNLQANTIYYWMVTAKDNAGHATNSPVWRFTTAQTSSGFRLIGHHNAGGSLVYVDGFYAYLSNGYSMTILDIANPSSPIYAGAYPIANQAIRIHVANNRAFLLSNGGLEVVDVSNPASPSRIANQFIDGNAKDFLIWASAYDASFTVACADSIRHYYFTNNYFDWTYYRATRIWCPVRNFEFADSYYFAVGGYSMDQFIVANEVNILASLHLPYAALSDLSIVGQYAYIANSSVLEIINIADPLHPTFQGGYVATAAVRDLAVSGSNTFMACDIAGVIALNTANPSNPLLIANYHPEGTALQLFVTQDYIYVVGSSGFYILEYAN